ncbi:OmpA family protein [Pseudaquabacterium pictum]|uniref:OmpA-like domain-containing protein n=1 Tax=Pseudaquabacterium pictum TaxID=2315236 RepID=A0A480AQK8_9BURK|nr:OmpA family protein [Rubrivivax pictus]GCL63110.1 hypothetical protein AQPW35_21910 [Rubrivivax pictus]
MSLLHTLARAAMALALATPAAMAADGTAPPAERTVDEMVEQLATRPATTTRGLRNLVPVVRQIDLVVPFDFDSARLQAASRPQLQRLAEAMNSPRLVATRFKVQGHTDAKGAAAYNDDLSARRARAVADFLQTQGVTVDRLQAEGKGASELLDPARPESPDNRRVRIVAMEPTP